MPHKAVPLSYLRNGHVEQINTTPDASDYLWYSIRTQRLKHIEEIQFERERHRKLEEEEEVRRLRKELVPKAQPMSFFDCPFIPKMAKCQQNRELFLRNQGFISGQQNHRELLSTTVCPSAWEA